MLCISRIQCNVHEMIPRDVVDNATATDVM